MCIRDRVGSGRSLKYWTTFDAANRISTVDDYMNQMALLSNWGARDNVSIAKICLLYTSVAFKYPDAATRILASKVTGILQRC